MLLIAAQIPTVGAQRIGGDTAFHVEMIQVGLDLAVKEPDRGRHVAALRSAKAVGRSGQGASTGRVW
ncbi:Uncharacterised protein [Mycobacteroides abscessus subsp. abscessus]|nr:Uncharacterised protein [Mycobacteroides abscessus subsp. abscessus]